MTDMRAEIINGSVKLKLNAMDRKKIQDVKAMLSLIEREAGIDADHRNAIANKIDELVKICVSED